MGVKSNIEKPSFFFLVLLVMATLLVIYQVIVFFVHLSLFIAVFMVGGNFKRVFHDLVRPSTYWYVKSTLHEEYEFGRHAKRSLQWRHVIAYRNFVDVFENNPVTGYIHEYIRS